MNSDQKGTMRLGWVPEEENYHWHWDSWRKEREKKRRSRAPDDTDYDESEDSWDFEAERENDLMQEADQWTDTDSDEDAPPADRAPFSPAAKYPSDLSSNAVYKPQQNPLILKHRQKEKHLKRLLASKHQRVAVKINEKTYERGVLRYVGPLPNEPGDWIGVELDSDKYGKNYGTVLRRVGVSKTTGQPEYVMESLILIEKNKKKDGTMKNPKHQRKYGIFVRPDRVKVIKNDLIRPGTRVYVTKLYEHEPIKYNYDPPDVGNFDANAHLEFKKNEDPSNSNDRAAAAIRAIERERMRVRAEMIKKDAELKAAGQPHPTLEPSTDDEAVRESEKGLEGAMLAMKREERSKRRRERRRRNMYHNGPILERELNIVRDNYVKPFDIPGQQIDKLSTETERDRPSSAAKVPGTVRFVGNTQFEYGTWIGVELDDAKYGLNFGLWDGVRYFNCKKNMQPKWQQRDATFSKVKEEGDRVRSKKEESPGVAIAPPDITRQTKESLRDSGRGRGSSSSWRKPVPEEKVKREWARLRSEERRKKNHIEAQLLNEERMKPLWQREALGVFVRADRIIPIPSTDANFKLQKVVTQRRSGASPSKQHFGPAPGETADLVLGWKAPPLKKASEDAVDPIEEAERSVDTEFFFPYESPKRFNRPKADGKPGRPSTSTTRPASASSAPRSSPTPAPTTSPTPAAAAPAAAPADPAADFNPPAAAAGDGGDPDDELF